MPRPALDELRRLARAGPPYHPDFLASLADDPRAGARALHAACLRKTAQDVQREEAHQARFAFERQAHADGYSPVAGVDEAGRGPLAGPIVAAAAILTAPLAGLNDSKQLKPEEREALYAALHHGGHAISVAVAPPALIDAWGIQAANHHVMTRALGKLSPSPAMALVDGFKLPGYLGPQQRIIKGDSRSLSIAAASIVAKVVRDRIMQALDLRHPGYGFARHKGYATAEHLDAIRALGPCPAHRMSFAPLRGEAPHTPELFAEATASRAGCAGQPQTRGH